MRTFLIALLLLLQAATAQADFALWVARVGANEGAFWDRRELELVWQTIEANGGRDRAGWLRRHSPRVHGTGKKQCREGRNCQWSALLNRRGDKPATMDVGDDIWEIRLRPVWLDLLAYADYLVAGGEYNRPCTHAPRTWGSVRYDTAQAERRGLYRMHCSSRFNDGFRTFWMSPIADGSDYRPPAPISYAQLGAPRW
jgi:hypothetical protein